MNTSNPNERRIEHRDFEVVIPSADGQRIAERISVKVPMEWDPEMQEWLITPDGVEFLERTKARYMGLLLPAELYSLRIQLGLTQSEIGDLLCIGEKSWTRWESGHQRPSQSLNLFLRSVQSGLISVHDLRRLRNPRVDWSPILAARDLLGSQPVFIMDAIRPLPCRQSPAPMIESAPLAA
jgi:DNA-binding transcriptional regulator YiaG